jgi:hypothetical protein
VAVMALSLTGQAQGEGRPTQTVDEIIKTQMSKLSETDIRSLLSQNNIEYVRVPREKMDRIPNLSRDPEQLSQSYIGLIRTEPGNPENFVVGFDIDLNGKVVDIRIDRLSKEPATK